MDDVGRVVGVGSEHSSGSKVWSGLFSPLYDGPKTRLHVSVLLVTRAKHCIYLLNSCGLDSIYHFYRESYFLRLYHVGGLVLAVL